MAPTEPSGAVGRARFDFAPAKGQGELESSGGGGRLSVESFAEEKGKSRGKSGDLSVASAHG